MFTLETVMKKIKSDSLTIFKMHAGIYRIRDKFEQRLKYYFLGSQVHQMIGGLNSHEKIHNKRLLLILLQLFVVFGKPIRHMQT